MSATAVSIKATWANERPLEELAGLVAARVEHLGETTKDAVIATAIDCLVSLRAMTAVAKFKKSSKSACEVKALPHLEAGFGNVGGVNKRVIRINGQSGRYLEKFANLMGPYTRGEKARVFLGKWQPPGGWYVRVGSVTYWNKTRYFIAKSEAQVRAWLEKKASTRIKTYGGLSRYTLGIVMGQLSTRDSAKAPPSGKAGKIGRANAFIHEEDSGYGSGSYSVEIESGIQYSALALKGANAVNVALMKAANKISGRIQHHLKGTEFEGRYQTPFPEVQRKGKRG